MERLRRKFNDRKKQLLPSEILCEIFSHMKTRGDFSRVILINKGYYDAYITEYRKAPWDWKSISYNPPIHEFMTYNNSYYYNTQNITWEIVHTYPDHGWNWNAPEVIPKPVVYKKPAPTHAPPIQNKYPQKPSPTYAHPIQNKYPKKR